MERTIVATALGPGTLLLIGVNTSTGDATISGGTLALGSGGSITASSGVNITVAGAAFDICSGNKTINDLSGVPPRSSTSAATR